MQFGILFTSHPNTEAEPYPHRDVHARVTQQIVRADELGYDYAWVAEHHFSNEYGIMPDVFVYAGYLAALTKRISLLFVCVRRSWGLPSPSVLGLD
jgi:alkanesulfonate monooxygenase SsuD/methylene tetrahydromethanopterin reductase-like flavin-dependent oxidoreductase (luciferase family)